MREYSKEPVAWRWRWRAAPEEDGWAYQTERPEAHAVDARLIQPLYATPTLAEEKVEERRPRETEKMAARVLKTFQRDVLQGYVTKDKQFAIEMLAKGFELDGVSTSKPEGEAERTAIVAWLRAGTWANRYPINPSKGIVATLADAIEAGDHRPSSKDGVE